MCGREKLGEAEIKISIVIGQIYKMEKENQKSGDKHKIQILIEYMIMC